MSQSLKYVVFLCSLLSLGIGRHDFHTSLTEMRLNEASNSYEITLRVFTDDFQKSVEVSNPGVKIDIFSDSSEPFVKQYIKKHFAFVKGKEVRFANYLGMEAEADATWIYLELNKTSELKGYSILNSIFMEVFDDQSNLLNVLNAKERHTLIFSSDNKLQKFPI